MESTPDRDNRHAKGAWSNWRRWAILLGAVILFARNVRAKQIWMEVIRIHYDCTTNLDLAPPGRPWSL